MIKKVVIENFQSYTKIELAPAGNGQLTVITGPSDSGKTAILRALRWLFVNEPQGDDFIRVGATFARVTAEYEGFDEGGGVVVRHRTSGGTNRYIVNGEKLEGFGRGGVPLEVKEITGVRPVKIGDLEFNLNIAEQLSGPFLGSSVSAPARAKVLGKLAGTEEIDYANRMLGTDLYRRNQDEKRLAAQLTELTEQIAGFNWLPDMARKIETLETLIKGIKANQETSGKLEDLRERYTRADALIKREQATIQRLHGLPEAERILAATQGLQQKRHKLAQLSEQLLNTEYKISECEQAIQKLQQISKVRGKVVKGEAALDKLIVLKQVKKRYEDTMRNRTMAQVAYDRNINAPKAEQVLTEIVELATRRKELSQTAESYSTAEQGIEEYRGRAVSWENRLSELTGAYQDLLISSGMCPTCGASTESMKIKEVV